MVSLAEGCYVLRCLKPCLIGTEIMKTLHILFLVLLVSMFAVSSQAETKKRALRGKLASTTQGGGEGVAIDNPFVGPGSESPISGSVSQLSKNEWVARVFNNGEDRVTASLQFLAYNEKNRVVTRRGFSANLKPGASMERRFKVPSGVEQAGLDVIKWKDHGENKKKKKEGESATE